MLTTESGDDVMAHVITSYSIHYTKLYEDRDAYQSSIAISYLLNNEIRNDKDKRDTQINDVKENLEQVLERFGNMNRLNKARGSKLSYHIMCPSVV